MSEQQKFFELIPPGTNIGFVRSSRKFVLVSIILILISIGSMVWNQIQTGSILNFGIDFQGGSTVRIAMTEGTSVGVQEVRDLLEKQGYEGASAVAVPDADNQVLIRLKEVTTVDEQKQAACRAALEGYPNAKLLAFDYPEGGSKFFLKFDREPMYGELDSLLKEADCVGKAEKGVGPGDQPQPGEVEAKAEFPVEVSLIGVGAKLQQEIDAEHGHGTVDHIVSSETVGAKVGNALKRNGALSLLYAIGFIFFYVMIRFDLRFAPGGIVALAHDSILVIGAFALTGREFTLQTIAALLTVIGYSINDTIVVFDRVRERVTLNRDEDIELTTNTALNETLSRTILTSGTTLLVVVSIWVLGSGPIKDFAFALFVGMIVGTYSSLFIASPVFLWVNRRFYGGEGHLIDLRNREREGTGTLLGGKTSQPTVDDGEIAHSPKALPEGEDGASADDDEDGPVVPDAADLAAKAAAQAALADDKPKKATRRRRRRPNSE
ncbi:MAG: protein translocase subunit SecF [Nannocystaceae bacterium]|nr:protein translocase subunit SecF [Myxococcales bacterium]